MMYAKPFIKWAGGKTQLLPEISRKIPSDFSGKRTITYIEPFVGGGAVLFWMLQTYPAIKRAVINDNNPDLINTYKIVKQHPDDLIVALRLLQNEYLHLDTENRKRYYLEKRDLFNLRTSPKLNAAALFLFLNKTSFNGLYRVNSKGQFNVPHGRYSNPKICNEELIRKASELLQNVEILCGDFTETLTMADSNSLFYLDPPYKPLSETSSFNSYTKEGFNDTDQIRLRDFCNEITRKGSKFILSNSDVRGLNPANDFFDELYAKYDVSRILATRIINADANKRGKLTELLITNIQNHESRF